jgi:hypothetical protein
MARIIVLSFEDNESAEMFAQELLGLYPNLGRPVVPPSAKIEAIVARPTSGCPGPHRVPGKMKPERGFTRTKRFGWFVCGTCKRPAKTVVENFIRNMLGGYNNLLPELQGGEPERPSWVKETLQEVQLQMNRRS